MDTLLSYGHPDLQTLTSSTNICNPFPHYTSYELAHSLHYRLYLAAHRLLSLIPLLVHIISWTRNYACILIKC